MRNMDEILEKYPEIKSIVDRCHDENSNIHEMNRDLVESLTGFRLDEAESKAMTAILLMEDNIESIEKKLSSNMHMEERVVTLNLPKFLWDHLERLCRQPDDNQLGRGINLSTIMHSMLYGLMDCSQGLIAVIKLILMGRTKMEVTKK